MNSHRKSSWEPKAQTQIRNKGGWHGLTALGREQWADLGYTLELEWLDWLRDHILYCQEDLAFSVEFPLKLTE